MCAAPRQGKLLVFGGETKGWTTSQLRDLYEFNLGMGHIHILPRGDAHGREVRGLETHRWSAIRCKGAQPPARSYHAAVVVDGAMFVIGGRTGSAADSALHDAWRLDLGINAPL